jgi:hypothetical protein
MKTTSKGNLLSESSVNPLKSVNVAAISISCPCMYWPGDSASFAVTSGGRKGSHVTSPLGGLGKRGAHLREVAVYLRLFYIRTLGDLRIRRYLLKLELDP